MRRYVGLEVCEGGVNASYELNFCLFKLQLSLQILIPFSAITQAFNVNSSGSLPEKAPWHVSSFLMFNKKNSAMRK